MWRCVSSWTYSSLHIYIYIYILVKKQEILKLYSMVNLFRLSMLIRWFSYIKAGNLFGSLSLESFCSSKCLKIFWNLQRFLADLNKLVLRIVLILPLLFSSPSLFSHSFLIIPSLPTTIGTTVTFKYCRFFTSVRGSKNWSIFSLFSLLILVFSPREQQNSLDDQLFSSC